MNVSVHGWFAPAAVAALALDRECENVKAWVLMAEEQGSKEDVVEMKEVGSTVTQELMAVVENRLLEPECLVSHIHRHQ